MLTLIHCPMSRSGSIMWLLEEIGAPYETKLVTIRRADGTGARDPGNPHPHGKVPALLQDGNLVFESGAIALYLVDLFPEAKMGPKIGDAKRGAMLSWLAYRSGVLEPAFVMQRMGVAHKQGVMGWAEADEVHAMLDKHLARNRYFLGDEFSVADIMVGGGINYLMMFKVMNETPVFKEYVGRITARPAYQRAMQHDAKK
jgi:glutathione S-transferase